MAATDENSNAIDGCNDALSIVTFGILALYHMSENHLYGNNNCYVHNHHSQTESYD
jgi:hypothetical protein